MELFFGIEELLVTDFRKLNEESLIVVVKILSEYS